MYNMVIDYDMQQADNFTNKLMSVNTHWAPTECTSLFVICGVSGQAWFGRGSGA